MSDNQKEAEEKMAKAIFISADCWLSVYDLLPLFNLSCRRIVRRRTGVGEPSIGEPASANSHVPLGIALISHRFDFYVDEHFKTRKWALKSMGIWPKIGKNGTKEMEIDNYDGKALPMPQVEVPRKVRFEHIDIFFIDRNAIAFLHHFRPIFPINFAIRTYNERILELILRNIWPMFRKNIRVMEMSARIFHRLRKFIPSLFNDCPSLRFVFLNFGNLFTEFPCDDSAMASDGQAMTNWLLTPHSNNLPKVFKCCLDMADGNWSSRLEAFKAINRHFLLVRCPIARDASKWTKWEEEAIGGPFYNQWNQIEIHVDKDDDIRDGLLNAMIGPNDQQK
ncbi:hypothetical protein niasHT_002400 [Heterodera trifolii]|uniref:Uncharacterized protein n=1 Tax=Heterodera trifolii TaxID=157864 RepID=A0ABD2LM63_9BILA